MRSFCSSGEGADPVNHPANCLPQEMEMQSSILWEGARGTKNRLLLLSSHHLPTSNSPSQGRGMLCAHGKGEDAFWEALCCAPHPQHLCHHLPASCGRPGTVPSPPCLCSVHLCSSTTFFIGPISLKGQG